MIAPKHTCNVAVQFAPALADGAEKGTLSLPYNGGIVTATFSGDAIAATLTAPNSEILTGAKPTKTGPAKSITIANHSKATIVLGPTSLSAGFAIVTDGCNGVTLMPAQKCIEKIQSALGSGTVKGQPLSGNLAYTTSYGANSGSVSIPLKSEVL